MKVKVKNSSSKKTRNLIKETFAILIDEKKELRKITVTELVKRAGITRTTFYTHYDNIYDIAQELQDEALEILLTSTNHLHSVKDVNNFFDELISHLKQNERIYSLLLSSDEPIFFANRLSKIISKQIFKTLKNTSNQNLMLNISFFTDGCINLVIKHYKGEISSSLDELGIYMKNMFIKVFIK